MEQGKYIAIEGIEKAGKSTQIGRLSQHLNDIDIKAIAIREPGTTAMGESLRELIKSEVDRAPLANLMLFSADRANTAELVTRPAIEAGKWVISDRSWVSTAAYQAYGEGLPIENVESITELAIRELIRPDLLLLLDLPRKESIRRMEKDSQTDYFEQLSSEFHDRVYKGYHELCVKYGGAIIDATGSEHVVEKRIWEKIEPLIS